MKSVYRSSSFLAMVLFAGALCSGCAATAANPTGFLSDYSKLQKIDGTTLRYFDETKIGMFERYTVEPVTVFFHDKARGTKTDPQTIREFENLAHAAVIRELSEGYEMVAKPGPGVARIRIAITDVQKDSPALNAIPQTRMTGVGLGQISMEGEIIDSETGEQIAAVIQSRKGSQLSFEGLSSWSSVEAAIDKWASDLRERIDKAHGR